MSDFEDVGEFNRKFGLPHAGDGRQAHALDADQLTYRFKFLLEELAEYAEAQGVTALAGATRELRERVGELVDTTGIVWPNLAGSLDALVDLAYVVHGTAHFHHFPFDAAWAEVQRANLSKERGPTAKRGHHLDVRKPAGWREPDIEGVLRRYHVGLASGFNGR